MRLAAYAGTSALLAAGALLKAFNQRPNFYSATVYLSQSNACVLILTNVALVTTVSFIYGLQRLLYGPLRPIEIEQLSEKAWYAVLDTLLAMPSLRDDVGGWLLATFVLLLAGKVWGWIGEGRVDILEQQPPANPRLFHIRLCTSLLVSIAFAGSMFRYSLKSVMEDPRPGMMVIFTFEFAIQTIFALFTFSRYLLALAEIRVVQQQTKAKIEERKAEIKEERERIQREAAEGENPTLPSEDDIDENEIDVPGWEEKRRYLFGLELATDFIKIIVYTVFFTISLTFIGLPMHIMRDVYLTFASFTKRIHDYSNYRKATHDMNSRYPDATAQELGNENTCIVCREAMIPWEETQQQPGGAAALRRSINEGLRAKKLPCGHILHLRCLKAWLERQQACPTCRRPVIPPTQPPAAATNALANAANQLPGAGAQGNAQPQGNADAVNNARRGRERRNRMRWLNMGPVRIGFYNGPANQAAEAIRQQQGGAATGAATAPATGGLPRLPTRTHHLTNQDHIRAVQMRLMEQANNMQIEAAQLANLRAMEAEVERLRSQISHATTQNPAVQGSRMFPMTQPFNRAAQPVPNQPPQNFPTPFAPTIQSFPQAFQPVSGTQPLGPGHADLPQGMTLPDDWSVLPLQRVSGQVSAGSAIPQVGVTSPPNPIPLWTPSTNNVNTLHSFRTQAAPPSATNTVSDSSHTVVGTSSGSTGPENSGLSGQRELPTMNQPTPSASTTVAGPSVLEAPPTEAETSQQPLFSTPQSSEQTTEQPQPQAQPQPPPWVEPTGWSFGDGQQASDTPDPHTEAVAQAADTKAHREERTLGAANGASNTSDGAADPAASAEDGQSPSGNGHAHKGKGRAVEVEEVADDDA
ncbi:hypothetical protein MBLNU457_3157t1 [Dothideomycetes sp. NU457]